MPTQSTQREPGQKKRGWFFGDLGIAERERHPHQRHQRGRQARLRAPRTGACRAAAGCGSSPRSRPPRTISAMRRHALRNWRTDLAGPRDEPSRLYGAYELLPLFISDSGRRKVTSPCSASSLLRPTRKSSPRPCARSRGVRPVSSGDDRQHRRGVLGARVGQAERQPVEGRVARVPRDEVVEDRRVLPGLPLEVHDVRLAVAALTAPVDLPLGWEVRGRARSGRDQGEEQRGGCQGQKRAHRAASVAPAPADVENPAAADLSVRLGAATFEP